MMNGSLMPLLCCVFGFATACNVFTMPLTARSARVSVGAGMLAGPWQWEHVFDIPMLMSLRRAKSRSYLKVFIKTFNIPSTMRRLKNSKQKKTNFLKLIILESLEWRSNAFNMFNSHAWRIWLKSIFLLMRSKIDLFLNPLQ